MTTFAEALRTQRWDDHRYYHHSRVNQTLHLISAISFLCAYALAFSDPAVAALLEPYRPHRHRVQRLVEAGGFGPERRGARMAPRRHLPGRTH